MASFSFGIIADPQYADKPMQINRYYRNALEKTQNCMDILKRADVDFVVCLGDVIDGYENTYQSERDCLRVQEIILGLEKPCYYVLGNHDVHAVHRDRLMALWGFPDSRGYYAFEHKNTQFIVLDTNFDQLGAPYLPGTMRWEECHVDEGQLRWLSQRLKNTSAQRTIIFTHALLDGAEYRHTVKNAGQVRSILEDGGKVRAVFQGHYHAGHTSLIGGIPYFTLKGLVDTPDAFSCWVVTVSSQSLYADIHTNEGIARI